MSLGGQAVTLLKCNPPAYALEALAAFVGTYENPEIASRHQIRVEANELIIDYGLGAEGGLAFAMDPIARDAFLVRPKTPGIDYRHLFRFKRDPAGSVVGVVVTMERLKNVRLSRCFDEELGAASGDPRRGWRTRRS